jgi:NAD(P)-dependent dehydrogenase (short-subunit alcohol dehydrogenase family)
MHVLVTGVSGKLGSRVASALAQEGETVRGADFLPCDLPGVECISAAMDDYDTCVALGEGVDQIVHVGAYHGGYLLRKGGDKSEKEFFDANVAGTFNMLRSAVENGVPKVVYASSVVVYERGHWAGYGIYSLTKVLGEEMCQYFNRVHRLKVIGLRLGSFASDDLLTRGFGMLRNWIEPDEVTKAVLAAVRNTTVDFGVYDVQTPVPLTPKERSDYKHGRRLEVLQRHWPQHAALLARYQVHFAPYIDVVDVHRTEEELGFRVEHDFGWFLDELSRRDREGSVTPDMPVYA